MFKCALWEMLFSKNTYIIMADKTSETDTDRWFHHFKMFFLGSIGKADATKTLL